LCSRLSPKPLLHHAFLSPPPPLAASATKHHLEHAVLLHRRPAVVVAHSMGNLVFLYFLQWLKQGPFEGRDRPWRAWVGRCTWRL